MAFTPDGMFYLSQKDLQPSMDTLGGAVRGMFGLQNKEEAVNAILQSADYDTPEGRRAALNQIKSIDPVAWEKYNKMNQDYELESLSKKAYAQQVELQNKSLQIKQEEREAEKRVPKLGNWWDINKKPGAIQYFLQTTQEPEHLKDTDWTKMNEAKAKALLRKIHKGGANQQIKSMQEELTAKRNTHIVNNKNNPDALIADKPLSDATTLFTDQASDKADLGNVPSAPVTPPAWERGKAFWDSPRPDASPETPLDEIY